jgi:hypothetical protein
MDEVEHVGADEDGAEFLEVAVLFILDFGNTPGVLAALDSAAVGGGDIALGADDGEGHGSDKGAGVLEASLVVFFERWGVNLDALGFDDGADLRLSR